MSLAMVIPSDLATHSLIAMRAACCMLIPALAAARLRLAASSSSRRRFIAMAGWYRSGTRLILKPSAVSVISRLARPAGTVAQAWTSSRSQRPRLRRAGGGDGLSG